MIIEILRGWRPLQPFLGVDPGRHIFDMSVGYDLAGISDPRIASFIDGLIDAGPTIDRLRSYIPEPFAEWRDHPFPTRVADTVTLSTFHGCPPDEIEAITKHLMVSHGVDVIVKLNPTLLGLERVRRIVCDDLGYREIELRPEAFAADLQFDKALGLIDDLESFAARSGRRFGIKLTNTLVVANHRHQLPDDPMYLSGPPLHLLATTLLAALDEAMPGKLAIGDRPGPVQVSFSAGITRENLPAVAALGATPITVCTDLLKPGGYGRLRPMLDHLREEIEAAACPDLDAWRERSGSEGLARYLAELGTPQGATAYARAGTAKLPRQVDHVLQRWGCVACNLCVTVCPNDAFLRLPTPEGMDVEGRQQYLCLIELCNECGNCTTFCPEEGAPWRVKPRLFIDAARFAAADGPSFLITAGNGGLGVEAAPGYEDDVAPLHRLIDGEDGLPLRAEDLATLGQ
jgi:putative selenate reductase